MSYPETQQREDTGAEDGAAGASHTPESGSPGTGSDMGPGGDVGPGGDMGPGGTGPGGDCDTLFYDGQCPLCASEIRQLREMRSSELKLVDIHSLKSGAPEFHDSSSRGHEDGQGTARSELTRDDLLRVLHLRRADGSWLKSADANVAAWEGTRHGRFLGVLRWPLVRHVVDLAYALWARWRYWRLYGAQFDEARHAPDQ